MFLRKANVKINIKINSQKINKCCKMIVPCDAMLTVVLNMQSKYKLLKPIDDYDLSIN